MTVVGQVASDAKSRHFLSGLLAGTALIMIAPSAFAQDNGASEESANADKEIVVSGIRASLESALEEKRNADSLIEVIQAEDIGKLPDQNLAEVLENITGVQITREAGVGTGVQIRGTDDNRSAINGVTLLSSGTGRGTISFEDINSAIVGSVEVTKAPEASSIEGSVGGTINLRTIRPLDLKETLISARVQGEYSELSGGSVTPRISAGFGKKWDLGGGEFGIVLSGSYAEQEATSFRPRVDRDNLVPAGTSSTPANTPGVTFPFLGIQFLNQELENFEYRTYNFAGTLEWAPSDNVKLYFDAIYNDQQRRQDSSRVQGSGVGGNNIIRRNVPTQFETVNFGSLGGVDLGSIEAALVGTITPNSSDADDPNLRFSSDVGARLTQNEVYRLGSEFEFGRFSAQVEGSMSRSNTRNPDLSTTLNFINPNSPLIGTGNDNQVPFAYDLSGGALAFGIDFDSALAPTVEQLLDPANVVLQSVTIGNNRNRNAEDAFRVDASLDVEDLLPVITSFDWGYRYNKTSSEFEQIRSGLSTSNIGNSPRGSLFSDLLAPGPNNFGDADGRSLFFRDFILVDPNQAFSNRDDVIATLQSVINSMPAVVAGTLPGLGDPTSVPAASFRVVEQTHAVYGQANFELGILRGNIGLRWVDNRFETFGNEVAGNVVTPISAKNGSSHLLPRINVAANLQDNLLFRASFSEDINRPDYNDLSLSVNFPATGQNAAVNIGNPDLVPEEVTSYDASLDWYFAPRSVISVGVFHKVRKNLFVTEFEDAATDANGFRDITPPCEGGGIFNPLPLRGVLSNIDGNGLCVPINTTLNDTGRTKQTGIEVAFQYDLGQFESLGFASGFGIQANATLQKFTGGTFENSSAADTRAAPILAASQPGITLPVTAVQGLLDFSKKAYNVTLYYEKYGISARARYTWRSAFRTLDTAGGATLGSTLGFPSVTSARGQLNAGINYDITDFITIGVEGVNLTKSEIKQYCVNDGALLCFQGLPDRRLTAGVSVRF